MRPPTLLVVAKAPVEGRAKTRLAATVGARAAARIAAAALLDTLEVAGTTGWPVVVALTGSLGDAERGREISHVCKAFRVVPQRGEALGERLSAGHADADGGCGVVQIGMDTPQVSVGDLRSVRDRLGTHDAAVGPAEDGGWWALGVRDARTAACLSTVPMSRPDTAALTRRALSRVVPRVGRVGEMRDVDRWDDACAVARLVPRSRFAAEVARVRREAIA